VLGSLQERSRRRSVKGILEGGGEEEEEEESLKGIFWRRKRRRRRRSRSEGLYRSL